jgi:hypothetical protein
LDVTNLTCSKVKEKHEGKGRGTAIGRMEKEYGLKGEGEKCTEVNVRTDDTSYQIFNGHYTVK